MLNNLGPTIEEMVLGPGDINNFERNWLTFNAFFVIKSLPDGGTKGCETQVDWQRKALIFLFTQNHLKATLYIIKI